MIHDKLVTNTGTKFKKGPAPSLDDIDKISENNNGSMRQDHAAIDPLMQYSKAFLIPFNAYTRVS